MAFVDRPASFLPTIKCSMCSQEIEISRMGEHICAGVDDTPDYTSNYSSLASNVYDSKRYEDIDVVSNVSSEHNDDYDNNTNTNTNNSYGYGNGRDDRGRVPPQVDTSAANRSYYRPGQLTPVSNSSGSQSVSPKTPVGTRGRSAMGMNNGSSNETGDYFEPTIANDYDSPSQRRPGGYGGLGPVEEPESYVSNNNNTNNYAPMGSPMKPAGPKLLQRMNTIAPGPFDVNRRPSNALARQERQERDAEFEPPAFGRAGTFPRLNSQNQNSQNMAVEPPSRAPSAPGPRPERRRHASNVSDASDNFNFYRSNTARMGPDTSRPPPPRTSLLRPRTAGRDGSSGSNSSSGSVPQINLADEFGIGNPYHSPHDSMSSVVSGLSGPSIPFSSSQSSFSSAFSAASFSTSSSSVNSLNQAPVIPKLQPARKNSNNADFDGLLNDLQSMKTTDRGLPSPQMQQSPTFSSGFDRRPSQAQEARRMDPPQRRPSQDPYAQPERRPSQDPYAQPGRRPSQDPYERRPSQNERRGYGGMDDSYNNNNNNTYGRVSPERNLQSRGRDDMDPYSRTRTPAPAAAPLPSRGNCKACGDLITGKSVSSADGRLTGRYHKACFVCTTCSEPFTSAEFYVHSDMPYCERHYHEVNGSLCGTCNNGIEGQYLADESDCKHHRTCFVCADCSQPLEDGYFEVTGKVYCERDAWRRLQQQQQQQQFQYQQQQQQQQQYQQPQRPPYQKSNLGVPRGLPSGPGMSRRPSNANIPKSMGMSSGMGNGPLAPPRQYGLPSGNRLGPGMGMGPGMGLGPGPRPRMEKRMTRLGMM